MEKLIAQVRRAHRRLLVEQFLGRLVWCLFAALFVGSIAVALPRVLVMETLPANWDISWLIGSAIAGLLSAVAWTWLSHRSQLDAAMEIDGRFGLRERVASSLSLTEADLETPAGQALLNDAVQRVERVEVGEKFRPRLSHRAWAPLIPAALGICLVLFVAPREASSSVEPPEKVITPDQIKKAQEELAKKLAEKRRLAEQAGLKDAADLFKEIEKGSNDLKKADGLDRKKAMVKINDLAKQLEERKNQLGGKDELQKQLNNMKEFGQGPADKLASAMKKGDWKKALDEIDKLREKIEKGQMNEQDKKDLQKQLDQMQQKLADAAQANRNAMKELQKQIDQQKKNGDLAKAAQLQQQLDKLAAQKPQMDKMQQMAQQLGQCKNCMKQGDGKGAAKAMQQMAQQLQQMQDEMGEMEMLDEAMQQLAEAKAAMQGGQQAMNGGQGNQFNPNPGGQGMGAGRGTGPRPDEENPTNFRDTRVRQKPGRGAATFGGLVDGPTVAGESGLSAQQTLNSADAEPADPLTAERLPRSRREHAEEYFSKLREEL